MPGNYTIHVLPHLILLSCLQKSHYYHPHFPYEKTKKYKGEITCPKLEAIQEKNLGFEPKQSCSRAHDFNHCTLSPTDRRDMTHI